MYFSITTEWIMTLLSILPFTSCFIMPIPLSFEATQSNIAVFLALEYHERRCGSSVVVVEGKRKKCSMQTNKKGGGKTKNCFWS